MNCFWCSGKQQKNIKAPNYWSFVWRIHQYLVDSPHKGPVMWIALPHNDTVMNCLLRGFQPHWCKWLWWGCEWTPVRQHFYPHVAVNLGVPAHKLCRWILMSESIARNRYWCSLHDNSGKVRLMFRGPKHLVYDKCLQDTYIHGLVQWRPHSIANALELHLSCPNPSIFQLLHNTWRYNLTSLNTEIKSSNSDYWRYYTTT